MFHVCATPHLVCGEKRHSQAPAVLHHHVAVLLEDDVVVVVVKEDRNGAEFGGSAAGLGNLVRFQQVDLRHIDQQKEVIHPDVSVSANYCCGVFGRSTGKS